MQECEMHLNLGAILQGSADEAPDATVIRAGDRTFSYSELDRAVRGVATSLRTRGIAPGDRVALLVPNVPEFTIAYFGILYAGATVVPINVLAAAPEVTYFLEDSGARMLIVHPLFREAGQQGAAPLGVPVVIATSDVADDTIGGLARAEPVSEVHPTSPQDTAVILYTSGTTGKPKGAELTHSNLLLNSTVVAPKLMPDAPDGHRALATLPLFHSFGQTVIQNAMIATGGSFTLLARFTPEEAFELIERDRLTVFAGVPTMYFALLHHRGDRAHDLSTLMVCLTGGAPMPIEVMNAFEEKFNVEIFEGFGLSETSPVASFNMSGKPRKAGSIGYPVWGVELCIVNDADEPLADDERGEICIRGHNIMKGYLGRPDATKEALRGGWFHSGDIGYRDSDGCYWIVDRKKDMILRGGFNVYPREVEEVLYEHEDVVEAAVIGVPHESHGEEIKAIVALGPDAKVTPEELKAFCQERLAAYKYPRIIEIIPELPKGPTGKILKRELRDPTLGDPTLRDPT
jgi:long-chain acyl-CoA synthetase